MNQLEVDEPVLIFFQGDEGVVSRVRTYEEILDDPDLSPEAKGTQCMSVYLSKDDSFITDLFLGQFRSTLKCTTCHNESVTFEPFWVISVPIPKATAKARIFHKEYTYTRSLSEVTTPFGMGGWDSVIYALPLLILAGILKETSKTMAFSINNAQQFGSKCSCHVLFKDCAVTFCAS